MKNVTVDDIQHKTDQLQRAHAYHYEYPDSEPENTYMNIQEDAPCSDVASDTGSD